jgi:hypothetical protein
MLLPIPIIADYNNPCHHRQTLIVANTRCKILLCPFGDYKPGDEILKIVYNPATLQKPAIRPFIIQQVHVNGTITILRVNNIYKCLNIPCVKPYCR